MPKINKQLKEAAYGDIPAPVIDAGALSLVKINNPFNRADREMSVIPYKKGQTLLDIRNTFFPEDVEVAVTLNGDLVSTEVLALTYPLNGDQIVMVPVLQKGDGGRKGAMLIVLAVALMVTAGPIRRLSLPERSPEMLILSILGV